RAHLLARDPGQVAAELPDGNRGLLAAAHVPNGDGPGLVLGAPVDQAPARPLIARPPELPAELAGPAEVDAGAQARGARRRRARPAADGPPARAPPRHPAPRPVQAAASRPPPGAKQKDPLAPPRAPGRGRVGPAELLDQVVITPARADGPGHA